MTLKQYAALCYRKGPKGREVLLVTSSSGRWILPKGWAIPGHSEAGSALVEAWEEGGVEKGKPKPRPLGSYRSVKTGPAGRRTPTEVTVYAVKVRKMAGDYPEADRRSRRWVSPKKAAKLVSNKSLAKILKRF